MIVPWLATWGLSISAILPDDMALLAWAVLVLWFLAVGLGVFIVCRAPSLFAHETDGPVKISQ
jgi:hypothetical protein